MQAAPTLVLRDIHQPPAPPWWPPAPGWWAVAAIVLLACIAAAWIVRRKRRRKQALARLFDQTVANAATPVARVAAISELLRRAARTRDPHADKLLGDDWLRFLDEGLEPPVFAAGAGQLLRDGAYRREVSASQVDALQQVARMRFLKWMAVR